MIQRISVQNADLFISACAIEPIYGSKCLCGYHCYGDSHPDTSFWVGIVDGTPASAMQLSGGVLTCASDGRLPAEELRDFLLANNVHEMDTNWPECEAVLQLTGGVTESSYYMYYRHKDCVPAAVDIFPCADLAAVFSVLQQSHEFYRTHYRFDTWSADLQRRIDTGDTEVFQLDLDGRPVATGSIISQDNKHAVLAAIAVIPEYRHRGLGREISRYLVQRILEKGKTPCLISGYDAVAKLYRQVGFQEEGRWGELYL